MRSPRPAAAPLCCSWRTAGRSPAARTGAMTPRPPSSRGSGRTPRTACGTGDPADGTKAGPAAARIPTTDVVSGIAEDPAAAALLPADVRKRGTLTLASSVGTPPGATYLPDGRTLAGQDIDFADAV